MSSFYEAVGGEATFRQITSEFYKQVREDDILRPMYPDQDFDGAEDRLRWFLMQYWGGPQTYGEQRGHPRLRMRHVQFPIDTAARDRWLELFGNAMATVDRDTMDDAHRAAMWDHAERVAHMLVNKAG